MKKQIVPPKRDELVSSLELVVSLREAERRSKGVSPRRHPKVEARLTGNDVSLLRRQAGRARHDVGSRRTRTLLSFQGPMPWRAGNEKASARARGLQIDGLRKGRIRIERRRSWIAGLSLPPSRAAGGV